MLSTYAGIFCKMEFGRKPQGRRLVRFPQPRKPVFINLVSFLSPRVLMCVIECMMHVLEHVPY